MLVEFKSKADKEVFIDSTKLVAAYELEPGHTILVFNGHQQGVQGSIREVVAKLTPRAIVLTSAPAEEEKNPEVSGKKRG